MLLLFFALCQAKSVPRMEILVQNRAVQRYQRNLDLTFVIRHYHSAEDEGRDVCETTYKIAVNDECDQFLYLGWDKNDISQNELRKVNGKIALRPDSQITSIDQSCIKDFYYPYLTFFNDLVHETFTDEEFKIAADSVGTAEFLDDQYTFCKNPLSKSLFWQTMENMEKLMLVEIDRSQPIEEL